MLFFVAIASIKYVLIKFLKKPSSNRYFIGAIFITAGVLHFIKTSIYIQIMPEYIPWHKTMVLISGAAEILGGIGVLIPKIAKWAGWGLIILLIAVFPANINMAVHAYQEQGISLYFIGTLLRLPLQFVLIYWTYWACIKSLSIKK